MKKGAAAMYRKAVRVKGGRSRSPTFVSGTDPPQMSARSSSAPIDPAVRRPLVGIATTARPC